MNKCSVGPCTQSAPVRGTRATTRRVSTQSTQVHVLVGPTSSTPHVRPRSDPLERLGSSGSRPPRRQHDLHGRYGIVYSCAE